MLHLRLGLHLSSLSCELFSGVLIKPPPAWHRRGYGSAPELVLHPPALGTPLSEPSSLPRLVKTFIKSKRDRDRRVSVLKLFTHWKHAECYFWTSLWFFHLILSSPLLGFFFRRLLISKCMCGIVDFFFLTFWVPQFVDPRVSHCNRDNLITMTSLERCHSMFVDWQVIALCSHGSPVTLIQAQPALSQTRGQWFSHDYGQKQ